MEKLYEYARKGETIERPKRQVKIDEIERISDLTFIEQTCHFDIKVTWKRYLYQNVSNRYWQSFRLSCSYVVVNSYKIRVDLI